MKTVKSLKVSLNIEEITDFLNEKFKIKELQDLIDNYLTDNYSLNSEIEYQLINITCENKLTIFKFEE
jgi:hypothetical protein